MTGMATVNGLTVTIRMTRMAHMTGMQVWMTGMTRMTRITTQDEKSSIRKLKHGGNT